MVLTLALLLPLATRADVLLEIPASISFYEAPTIRITDLRALETIILVTMVTDARGTQYTSRASFRADVHGVVDTKRSVANGDYEGVDPMGPFWSVRGEGVFRLPLTGSIPTTIRVENADGTTLASATIERVVVPESVTVTKLQPPAAPFAGILYEHPATQKRPIVITLTGSAGGIDPWIAPWVVSQGYDVLSLGYFNAEGLPPNLLEVPLEYFLDALQWCEKRASASPLGIVGVSKGAEAALLIASYFPDHVRAVGAWLPTHVVWEGIDTRGRLGRDPNFQAPGKSGWSLHGKPLPYVPKFISAQRRIEPPLASLDAYAPQVEKPVDPAARIPVERIRASVFMTAAGDDLAWPSLRMAREVKKQLAGRRRDREVQLHEYSMAGHFIFTPGMPVSINLGGTRTANATASSDAWPRLAKFLRATLGPR
jgi:dienelactone hydrolase